MHLALNTFIYEVAKVPVEQALQSAGRFGFTFIEYAAYHSGDPALMNQEKRREVIQVLQNNSLVSAQVLLTNTQYLASPDPKSGTERSTI